MNTPLKIKAAAQKLVGNVDAIEALLDELVMAESIRFDDECNAYWESCGETVDRNITLVYHDDED